MKYADRIRLLHDEFCNVSHGRAGIPEIQSCRVLKAIEQGVADERNRCVAIAYDVTENGTRAAHVGAHAVWTRLRDDDDDPRVPLGPDED